MIDRLVAMFAVAGFLGFCSIALFAFIGSDVGADGFLHEPFVLLATGHGLIWLGMIGIIILLGSRAIWRIAGKRHNAH